MKSNKFNYYQVNAARGEALLESGMLATDLAHALVRRGVPFRRAHHLIGAVLQRAAELAIDLRDMSHDEYLAIW